MLTGKVLRVIDGDTIEIQATMRVRLDFIDAPETRGPEREQGLKVKQWLTERLSEKTVELDIKKSDMYDRFLAVVYIDGENINGEMVKKGLVEIYQPNHHNDGILE